MQQNKSPKISKKFSCIKCNYKCSKQSEWNKHLSTRKHKNATNETEKSPKISILICECGKQYNIRSSLWRHKKKCTYEEKQNMEEIEKIEKMEKTEENDLSYKEMVVTLIKDNTEMRKTIQDMIPKISGDVNSHNNTQFNINVFLNEECKDALNIKDFVNSLQLQLKDLDNTGKLGFVEGTSKIFIDGLNKLEITKRPIHCSDIAEETLYIKDNDTWEKENKNKDKMKQAIDEITNANMKQMPEWVKGNPTFAEDEEYMKVISNIMNVMDNSNHNKEKEKIINNVAKETLINE
jgi:hypothetical protein